MPNPPAFVAVPVKNEADRIQNCVQAIANQRLRRPDGIILLINGTTDGTADVCRAMQSSLDVELHVIEHEFAPENASAGAARRLAMTHAAQLAGERGVLFTTDADGVVPDDWIAINLHHIEHGIDAVAGRVVLDPADAAAIPATLHENDALEVAYGQVLDEIAWRLNPTPWDPWPRHAEHSGASIAVTMDAYRRVGGMPASPLAEDRRFFAALRSIDARIRHAAEIEVVVSGRTIGRAEGGMADTIRRRITHPDPYLDDVLEPAAVAFRRASVRAKVRAAHASARRTDIAAVAEAAGVSAAVARQALTLRYAGQAADAIEAASPLLARELVNARDVLRETEAARAILDQLLVDGAEVLAAAVL